MLQVFLVYSLQDKIQKSESIVTRNLKSARGIFVILKCLGGKLAALEEFKVQKEDLMAKMAGLEAELTKQEDDHKEEIYKIERKQVVDKDRWL